MSCVSYQNQQTLLQYWELLMSFLETDHKPRTQAAEETIAQTAAGLEIGRLFGGLLGGRMGALAGTLIGGAMGYSLSEDKDSQSFLEVLHGLPDPDKCTLVLQVMDLIGSCTEAALRGYTASAEGRDELWDLLKLEIVKTGVAAVVKACTKETEQFKSNHY